MLKIAVVEDQQEVRDELCRFIRKYAAENSLQVEAVPIEDGAAIAAHYEPGWDIIFMDVEMPGLDGFGAAEKIRAVDGDAVLVFVTNMAQYAIKGYEVDALDYVLKPVNYYYQFCTKLSRAVQRVERRRGRQVVLQLAGGGMQVLSTNDIYYLETRDRLLWYHTAKGEFSVRASLASARPSSRRWHPTLEVCCEHRFPPCHLPGTVALGCGAGLLPAAQTPARLPPPCTGDAAAADGPDLCAGSFGPEHQPPRASILAAGALCVLLRPAGHDDLRLRRDRQEGGTLLRDVEPACLPDGL